MSHVSIQRQDDILPTNRQHQETRTVQPTHTYERAEEEKRRKIDQSNIRWFHALHSVFSHAARRMHCAALPLWSAAPYSTQLGSEAFPPTLFRQLIPVELLGKILANRPIRSAVRTDSPVHICGSVHFAINNASCSNSLGLKYLASLLLRAMATGRPRSRI